MLGMGSRVLKFSSSVASVSFDRADQLVNARLDLIFDSTIPTDAELLLKSRLNDNESLDVCVGNPAQENT